MSKSFHPAISAATDYWCETIKKEDVSDNVLVFRKSLLDFLAKIYDSSDGVIVLHSKVSTPPSGVLMELGNSCKALRKALKKSKINIELLPAEITMTISTNEVKVYEPDSVPRFIWKAPPPPKHNKIY